MKIGTTGLVIIILTFIVGFIKRKRRFIHNYRQNVKVEARYKGFFIKFAAIFVYFVSLMMVYHLINTLMLDRQEVLWGKILVTVITVGFTLFSIIVLNKAFSAVVIVDDNGIEYRDFFKHVKLGYDEIYKIKEVGNAHNEMVVVLGKRKNLFFREKIQFDPFMDNYFELIDLLKIHAKNKWEL